MATLEVMQTYLPHSKKCKGKGKGKLFPLQARLWPRGWVEV